MQKYKLGFELVPDGCWADNLRTHLPKGVWDILRRKVYEKSGYTCEICGAKPRYLDAHEKWSYDEKNRIQKLEKVMAVCRPCHEVIHINRTFLKGNEVRASEHFMKVNGCNYAGYRRAMAEANEKQKELNKVNEWLLDVGWIDGFLKD
ncbi:MAG: HNH endonuclease [Clostridia bacterium]|nr:HNH endonuclease [Clostridia bacterium]